MRQFTTPEQTAKLIELGFAEPKSITSISWDVPEDDSPFINANSIEFEYQYSIGELIQMLPPKLGGHHLSIERYIEFGLWIVCYEINRDGSIAPELCDALYNMIVKMKEYKMI